MGKKYFLTHSDLDGFGGYVFFKVFMQKLGYTCIQINYDGFAMNSRLMTTLIKEGESYYFHDITPPLAFLDAVKDKEVFIVDHHKITLLEIMEHIKTYENDVHIFGDEVLWDTESGTSLLFKFLPFLRDPNPSKSEAYKWFYDRVRVYDLWLDEDPLWDDAVVLQRCWVHHVPFATLDKSFNSGNYDDWIDTFCHREKFERWERIIGYEFQEEFNNALVEKLANLKIKKDDDGNVYGVFGASSMNSLLCSALLKAREDIKYILCVNTYPKAFGNLSLRTRNDRNFSVAGHVLEGVEFKGHKCASGAKTTPLMLKKFMSS